MGHLVRYSSPGGEQRYEDVADLDAAVERVEHLRNVEGVSDVRVYREVPLEFRTYVQVAVADEEPRSGTSGASDPSGAAPSGAAVIAPPPSASQAEARSPEDVEPSDQGAEAQAVETQAAENRRISLFNRGGSAS